MFMHRLITTLLSLYILLVTSDALAFPGEARAYFKDWLVVCQKDFTQSNHAGGGCRTNVGIRDKTLFSFGDGTIFQFTIARDAYSSYHIEFYHTLAEHFPTEAVTFQIDDQPAIALNMTVQGNLAQLTPEQTRALIPSIKAGHRLTIHYLSRTGEPTTLTVSLRGSTASLLFIDEYYMERGY